MTSLWKIHRVGEAFVAASAIIAGDVTLSPGVNIWHYCVLRGDVAGIRLGRNVNVQDGSVLHCNLGVELVIDDNVAIGHLAMVHCARIGSNTLIANGAKLLDDAVIGHDCIVAAGAVVPPRMVVPDGHVVMGLPAKIARATTDKDREYIRRVLEGYQQLARLHVEGRFPGIDISPRSTEGQG